jgi:very-short-patch-repair endonuclease
VLPTTAIRRLGGLAATYELEGMGISGYALTRATRSGEILRVRQGWYCAVDEQSDRVRAARVGGRLTCRSACDELGLWSRSDGRLHVAVPATAARLRSPDDLSRLLDSRNGVVVHWTLADHRAATRFRVTALQCLLDLAACESADYLVAAADSALRRGSITRRDWMDALESFPARVRAHAWDVDPASESIIESLARVRLHQRGVRLRTQVPIARGIRVDLLVGARLVIELDGREFHAGTESFDRDRRRDARLSALGFRVLRFSYHQVVREWPRVQASVLAAMARGDAS